MEQETAFDPAGFIRDAEKHFAAHLARQSHHPPSARHGGGNSYSANTGVWKGRKERSFQFGQNGDVLIVNETSILILRSRRCAYANMLMRQGYKRLIYEFHFQQKGTLHIRRSCVW